MKKAIFILCVLAGNNVFAQNDSSVSSLMNSMEVNPVKHAAETKIFNAQRLINLNTVEVLHKGAMEFKVIHNFYDIAGKRGGIHNFFGLDNAADIKIGFQVGLTDKLNVVAARTRGDQFQGITELWELGFKYSFMKQMENDPRNPLSITAYVNTALSAVKAGTVPNKENSYSNFSDRLSQLVQVMVARKFGKISLQLTPTFLHTDLVVPGDDKSLFAIGAGLRIPITKSMAFITDYYHAFRSQRSKDSLNATADLNPGVYDKYGAGYDVIGVGFEFLTAGHVFHLNFTNATNILENRFIPRTLTSWGKGQYRWGFTIGRNFILFRDKKKK